jgi:hypothetical protein
LAKGTSPLPYPGDVITRPYLSRVRPGRPRYLVPHLRDRRVSIAYGNIHKSVRKEK